MHGRNRTLDRETYLNPVYPNSFPDPFVLKHRGRYYGYCTGDGPDGLVFGIIRSDDLVSWHAVGGAMEPIPEAPPFYWAPEVTYDNGKFYLYYSAGNETLMHLRVAVSDRPDGGFVDSGRVLTTDEFAIDAHVFIDEDGSRYMFYATDFLEHTHIGTGTVVDRMLNWFELEGNPRPVTRAKYDWQVYDPQRKEKGGVRWHTVEGPTVLKRKGLYFEMFSGGNWQNTTYGVSYATAEAILGHGEWHQNCDGQRVLPILRTLPGLVVGPGHNSVVRGPNNRELYCVYHCWTDAGRVLAIDRMDFASDRIFVIGATHTPQIAPYEAVVNETESGKISSAGIWEQSDSVFTSSIIGTCERTYQTTRGFVCEFTFRCREWEGENSRFGFRLGENDAPLFEFSLSPNTLSCTAGVTADEEATQALALPPDFDVAKDHLIRVEVNGTKVKIAVGGSPYTLESRLSSYAKSFSIYSESAKTEFAALTITEGFEDLFDSDGTEISNTGWKSVGSHIAPPRQHGGELTMSSGCRITHEQIFNDVEFAANIRLGETRSADAEYGVQLVTDDENVVASLGIKANTAVLSIAGVEPSSATFALSGFIPESYHQLRLINYRGRLAAALDDVILGELKCVLPSTNVSVFCSNSSVFVEMARATSI